MSLVTIRGIELLQPQTQERLLRMETRLEEVGLPVLFYDTLRSVADQARCYRNGRPFSTVEAKAEELGDEWGRPDLGQLLIDVGPQYGTSILTNAGPGQSAHNYALAIDGCPKRFGKLIWVKEGIPNESVKDAGLWQLYGKIAVEVGFEWAGHWTRFTEYPHIQEPGFHWTQAIREHGFDLEL